MSIGFNFSKKFDMTGVHANVQNDGSLESMIARKNYLKKRIYADMASAKEVEEYKQLNREIAVKKRENQGSIFSVKKETTPQVPTKNNVNKAWNQVRSAFSELSNVFSPKTSDNAGEKEGDGIDE